MIRWWGGVVVAAALVSVEGSVSAEEPAPERVHEIALGVSYLPSDAFVDGLLVHATYAYRLTPIFAIQAPWIGFCFNWLRALARQLIDVFGVQPTNFPQLSFVLGSRLSAEPPPGLLGPVRLVLAAGPSVRVFGSRASFADRAGLSLDVEVRLGVAIEGWSFGLEPSLAFVVTEFDRSTTGLGAFVAYAFPGF